MSIIHETLYESEDLSRVDFLSYLEALARNLELALAPAGSRISIDCSGTSVELPIDSALPLGLIANELLTNAIKHAFPAPWEGEAAISALLGISPEGMPFLAIEDNGVGFAVTPVDDDSRAGLGLTLVDILARQLGAAVSRACPETGGGTRWRVELPAKYPPNISTAT
jgi:two-component sensor histidine kinase